jgi:1-acyl-sn-glycerol-3-phosphate acyltransferase
MDARLAIITLLVIMLLLLPVACLALVARRTHYTLAQTFYWLFAKLLVRFLWRTTVEGTFPVPADGKAVIICNHRSSIDPFFIQTSVDRVVHWMVAREYCEHWFFGFFMRIAEVIPVNRAGIDTAATKLAIRLVAQGGMVGMLPEGRINTTDQLMRPVRPGAVIIALKAKAPIIPCYIEGAPYYRDIVWSPFFMRARVRVRFGQPMDLSAYHGQERDPEVVKHVLKESVQAIARLAGEEDYDVVLAGRQWKADTSESGDEPAATSPKAS